MNFGNQSNDGGASRLGSDLETIQTEALGFHSIAGDSKVRLTSAWSTLPSPTACLLSISSRGGLVAAAGPDQVVVTSTDSIRKAYEGPKVDDSEIRSFNPQCTIPMSMRVSQLAFTADSKYLILSAESGGGLAVYDVQSLLQGSTTPTFELPTNGESLRYLTPNPTPEKADLCALVTDKGNLLMANLAERKMSNSLKGQVSCISWSTRGKQLCAGLSDGTVSQLTPEGEDKGQIPKPSSLGDYHVSSLTWLENNLFLVIHTTTGSSPPSSVYHLITRQSPSDFTYQKLADPTDAFGSEKSPSYLISRLREFPPALQDVLIICSTASTEVGLLTRSKAALASDKPADTITDVFTHTELLDDTRRPTLPMTDSMEDSIPIGAGLDLSSKEIVYKPIPSDDEINASSGPLPAYWILTHEGILCAWWIVYTDSIKQGTTYPGLSDADAQSTSMLATPVSAGTPKQPAAFGSPMGTNSSNGGGFGSSNSGRPVFGSTTPVAPAFGASSQMGQKSSPWGAGPSQGLTGNNGFQTGGGLFGSTAAAPTPAFGQTSAIGFGQSTQPGARASPWATAGSSTPAFGQSPFGTSAAKPSENQSIFGTGAPNPTSSNSTSTGGFAGFANKGGFGSVNGANSGTGIFGSGSKLGGNTFGDNKPADSSMGTAFPAPKQNQSAGQSGGFGSQAFKLQSSFKPDHSTDKDSVSQKSGTSLFGSAFGSALDQAQGQSSSQSVQKDEEMDVGEATTETPQPKKLGIFSAQADEESTTPKSTPGPSTFGLSASPAPGTSLFGQPTSKLGASGGFFGANPGSPNPPSFSLFSKPKESTPPIQRDTDADADAATPKGNGRVLESTPLPPDTMSKVAYPLGDSSSSSAASTTASQKLSGTRNNPEAAPLPPDFTALPKPSTPPQSAETAPLPPDFAKAGIDNSDKVDGSAGKPNTTEDIIETVEAAPLPPDPPKQHKSVFDSPIPAGPAPSNPFANAPPPVYSDDDSESGLEDDADGEDGEEQKPEEDAEGDSETENEQDEDVDENDDDEDDAGSEGSGIDVAKDLSPSLSGLTSTTIGFTPQTSFKRDDESPVTAVARPVQGQGKSLFGELGRNAAPKFPQPVEPSQHSPSPVRSAIPNRFVRTEATRSVSAPGMASSILGSRQGYSHSGASIISNEKSSRVEEPFMAQQRRNKARQEAEEQQPLVDEEDDDLQKVLASEVEGTLQLDEFIAHSNVAPPARESIPSQVEAVYRDINCMIDTLGLNARSVRAFTKGHTQNGQDNRSQADLEDPDGWVLCEVGQLGDILEKELGSDLEESQVQDLGQKMELIRDLTKDMHRLRAKQDDLRRLVTAQTDTDGSNRSASMPLSAEQSAQQNELRREFAKFTKLLSEAEGALTLFRTKLVSQSGSSGRGNGTVPTFEAVMRTITKMTSMAEKRSGDIDVLENQLRKVRLSSASREGSPMVTPQGKRSVMFSVEGTPSRSFRHSLTSSVSFGANGGPRATPPRKKLSGFSVEEKGDLMKKRANRKAVLSKLKSSVEKKGVSVWVMQDETD